MNDYVEFNGIKYYKNKFRNKYYYYNSDYGLLHRALWEFYNGIIPSGYDIHHKDLNGLNNDIENLECLTKSEHKRIHLYGNQYTLGKKLSKEHKNKISIGSRGGNNGNAKLTELDVKWIKCWLNLSYKQIDIAKAFNTTKYSINDIKNNRTWKHV